MWTLCVVVVTAFFLFWALLVVVSPTAFFKARTLVLHLSLSATAFCSAAQLSAVVSMRMSPCCLL